MKRLGLSTMSDPTDQEIAGGILKDVRDTRYVTHTRLRTYTVLMRLIRAAVVPSAIGYLKQLGWYVMQVSEDNRPKIIWNERDDRANKPR